MIVFASAVVGGGEAFQSAPNLAPTSPRYFLHTILENASLSWVTHMSRCS